MVSEIYFTISTLMKFLRNNDGGFFFKSDSNTRK